MDKISEIFNFDEPPGKLIQCLNNLNENTKLQEFNYNNIIINNLNKEKKLNKIPINIKKENNYNYNNKDNSNDNKNKINEQSKKYFSFDGENQISEDNKKDKSKDNNDNSKNKNIIINIKNNINFPTTENINIYNNCFDSPIKNKNNNSIQKETNNISTNSIKLNNLNKEKEDLSNNNNNDSKKNINSPPKKCKLKINRILLSEEKIPSKEFSIQREKKLLNKNLIGYLAFNSSISIQSKNSMFYDDSFSSKNSKILDKNPSKLFNFNNKNNSIDKLNQKSFINNNIDKKIKKINHNKTNKYLFQTLDNNNLKEISINLKFNNYLNRSRNLNNNNIQKSFTKNERVFNFIMKSKTLPKINSNIS